MKIQFIGCGKMGEVILKTLLKYEKKENIFIETKTQKTKKNLKNKYQIKTGININIDIIFLLVKPQQFKEIDFSIFKKDRVYISFIAGLSIARICKNTFSNKIIRVMPNTPILVGKGVIGYFLTKEIKKKYKDFFIKVFSKNSELIVCKTEDKIDKITALSGSGPAYFYYFVETMKEKALEFGFSELDSIKISNNTFIGSASLLEQSGLKVEKLRKNITSKGGTTKEAIKELEKNNFKNKLFKAIEKAYVRAKVLGK